MEHALLLVLREAGALPHDAELDGLRLADAGDPPYALEDGGERPVELGNDALAAHLLEVQAVRGEVHAGQEHVEPLVRVVEGVDDEVPLPVVQRRRYAGGDEPRRLECGRELPVVAVVSSCTDVSGRIPLIFVVIFFLNPSLAASNFAYVCGPPLRPCARRE